MHITYTDKIDFSTRDLQQLFQSVDWMSANYPDRLKKLWIIVRRSLLHGMANC